MTLAKKCATFGRATDSKTRANQNELEINPHLNRCCSIRNNRSAFAPVCEGKGTPRKLLAQPPVARPSLSPLLSG